MKCNVRTGRETEDILLFWSCGGERGTAPSPAGASTGKHPQRLHWDFNDMQTDLHIFQAIKLKSTWYTGPCRSQAGSGGSALCPKRRRFPLWNRFSIIKTTPTYFKRKRLSSEGGCTISEAAVLAGVFLGTSKKDIFPFSNLTLKLLWV